MAHEPSKVKWDAQRFREVLKEATRAAFHSLKGKHSDEHFYAFGLYTNDVGQFMYPTANTEEAFRRRLGDPQDWEGAALRWLPGDWGYHLEGDEFFSEVQEILGEVNPYSEELGLEEVEAHAQQVFQSAIQVLRELDDEGLFGRGAEREQLVLTLLLTDMSYEQQLAWAKQLNPENVWKQLEVDLQGAADALERKFKAEFDFM